jgi:predicted dehydrogenase
MQYKCALIGCGRRAAGHAAAYRSVRRGTLVAACDPHEEKVRAFCERYGIPSQYTNVAQMLERERPDVIHVVTRPNARLDILELASDLGVPAAIVEKPIASGSEEYTALRRFAGRTRMKACVNHQLHFHPRLVELRKAVRDGAIGRVGFVEASARLNLAYQGTHLLQLIGGFVGPAEPVSVFGQVAGAAGLSGDRDHYSPDECVAAIEFSTGTRAQLLCGPGAPRTNDGAAHLQKRIAVYGSFGAAEWTMWSWQHTLPSGTSAGGSHDYFEEDALGQSALTEAAFDWLDDDGRVHPTNLASALNEFNVIVGIYLSALRHAHIRLPAPAEPDLLDSLRAHLAVG